MPGDRVTAGAYVLSVNDRWLIADALWEMLNDWETDPERPELKRLIRFLAPDEWKIANDYD